MTTSKLFFNINQFYYSWQRYIVQYAGLDFVVTIGKNVSPGSKDGGTAGVLIETCRRSCFRAGWQILRFFFHRGFAELFELRFRHLVGYSGGLGAIARGFFTLLDGLRDAHQAFLPGRLAWHMPPPQNQP